MFVGRMSQDDTSDPDATCGAGDDGGYSPEEDDNDQDEDEGVADEDCTGRRVSVVCMQGKGKVL